MEFLDKVDLRRVDLTDIIKISHKKIEVYPEHSYFSKWKPKVGEGLNKPAYIYFYDMRPPNGNSLEKFLSLIKTFVEMMKAD